MSGAAAVAILSGGLDSTVSLALACRAGLRPSLAVFFDYGQKARLRERAASRAIARRYGAAWREIPLPWLGAATSTGLVRGGVPAVRERDLDDRSAGRRSARAVWVPNRNGVFLNVAAALAESRGARWVLTGFDREEAATFPDNSAAFIAAANRALAYSTANRVRVRSFVRDMSKAAIVAAGLRLRAPLDRTWSCYIGGSRPCGRCESCARARRAFRDAGAPALWSGPA